MKQIGVTVYTAQPKEPQLSYRITTCGVENESGTILQSRVFELADGQEITLAGLITVEQPGKAA